MSSGAVLHDDQPALGPDFDPDAVSGAVLLDGVDECSLAVKHHENRSVAAKSDITVAPKSGHSNLLPARPRFQQVNCAQLRRAIKMFPVPSAE
jgi:hypothetical protein